MKPYTYLIKHKPTGRVYYGFRSANKVSPEEDLWNKYFTSSPRVQELIEETGADSFDVQIRKVFETQEQAVLWESKVLRRMRVLESDTWINQNIAGYVIPDDVARQRISDYHKGKPKTAEHKKNLSKALKGRAKPAEMYNDEYRKKMSELKSGKNNGMYGRTHSEETRRKIREGIARRKSNATD